MITISKFRYQEVMVVGLGRTGFPAVMSLLQGQAKVYAFDDNLKSVEDINIPENLTYMLCKNAIAKEQLFINPDPDSLKYSNIKSVIVSPGIPLHGEKAHPIVLKAKEHNIPLTIDIELLYETCKQANYVAITGTNGKSTTTSLMGHILKSSDKTVQVGGNIGISALLLEPLENKGTYVLELSSFQLDLMSKAKFNIAIFLNLTPDHLDRHGTFEAYKKAKLNIFNNQTRDDYAIISIDHEETKLIFDTLAKTGKQRLIPISTKEKLINGVSVIGSALYDNLEPEFPKEYNLGSLKRLVGKHNAENIAASYAASKVCGVDEEKIISAIQSFAGLSHRLELVLEKGKLAFINDSKATNADAAEKALQAYKDIYWIAGGVSKDDGIECLSYLFDRLKHVYLIGQATPKFAAVLDKYNIPYTKAENLENALKIFREANVEAGNMILAPACASLDQWKSYEHRGDAFRELVLKMWG
jgi:UDP-N-acetylmuramoylalanine--D-glutamate ligase